MAGGTVHASATNIMPTMFKSHAAHPMLFNEIVRTVLDIDPVMFFYASAAMALTFFWATGCSSLAWRVAVK